MVDAAWRNLVVTGRAFKYEQIDAQSIPYQDETFDIIIANFMLYHVRIAQKRCRKFSVCFEAPTQCRGNKVGILLLQHLAMDISTK